jgi:hypothetical protein
MESCCAGSVLCRTREFYRRQKNRGRAWDLHIQIPHLHLLLRKTSIMQNTITTTTITTIVTAVAITSKYFEITFSKILPGICTLY